MDVPDIGFLVQGVAPTPEEARVEALFEQGAIMLRGKASLTG